jgi:hypothetical protein
MRDFLSLVIGIGIVFVYFSLIDAIHDAEQKSIISIAGECRILRSLSQPLTPEGPCFEPEVRRIWEHLPVEPLEVETP